MPSPLPDIPDWLAGPERYRPASDRDGFITGSILRVSEALARFRLDAGRASRLSPTAPVKLLLGLGTILLVSLARNFLFVLVVLAALLVRACLLPRDALARLVGGAGASALLAAIVMLPATLIGQPRAALMLAGKALVSTGVALTVALTTPHVELTGALRALGVPGVAITVFDLALRGIVQLGTTAREALVALRLRSVGRNRDKRASMGGVGGVVLLKAARSAEDTLDAMRCRGFDGTYGRQEARRARLRPLDAAWLAAFCLLALLFFHLQGAL